MIPTRPAFRRRLLLALAATVLGAGPAVAQPPVLVVGQEWSVKDTTAKVIIGRIDRVGAAEVVNVSVVEVPTDHGHMVIGQAPFQKAALMGSLSALLAVNVAPNPAFDAGYRQWRASGGSYVTLSVAQTIAATLKSHEAPLRH